MTITLFHTGWNYSQDGPGNRMILHFQGCNFDCPWCSNPEGRSLEGSLFVRKEHLTESVCPHGAVKGKTLNRDICRRCRKKECLNENRNQGIGFSSFQMSVEELVQKAAQSKPLFYDGGGVTVTGGEATLQFPALMELLKKLKAEGIHTALETNGSHPKLPELFPFLDLLILDIKHWNRENAGKVIGKMPLNVFENLKKANLSDVSLLARITLIPGFNSTRDDMERFISLFNSLPEKQELQLELLLYHHYGREKWEAIGEEYRGPGDLLPEEKKSEYEALFRQKGITIINT